MAFLSVVGFWSDCSRGHDARAGAGPADMAYLSVVGTAVLFTPHDSHAPTPTEHRLGIAGSTVSTGCGRLAPGGRRRRPAAGIAHGVG